jgi:hypothetical protein
MNIEIGNNIKIQKQKTMENKSPDPVLFLAAISRYAQSFLQFLHSIVDASRLDLSSPAPGDSPVGFDESNREASTIEFILPRTVVFMAGK